MWTWGVLGLRLRIRCDISLVSQLVCRLLCAATAVAVAGAFGTVVVGALSYDLADGDFTKISVFVMKVASTGGFTLVGFYMCFDWLQPAIEEALQHAAAAGGHYASEAQATPRVDVGDPPEASSFHQATGSHDIKDEERSKVQKFQVFVKNLAGKTVVVRGLNGMDEVSLVVGQVESLTGVPRSMFYLVGASGRRIWEDDTLEKGGLGPDSSLTMTARLLGGSMRQRAPLVPGSWTCNNCNMGGCWPSRNVCFRCLAPRPMNGPRFSSPTPAGETQHLGRAPQVQRTGNPTFRRGTVQPQPQPVHKGKPDMTSALKGDGMAVLKALRGLGVSEALLEQVQASLVPKRTDPGNAKEKALAEKKAQLTALRARIGRQEQSVANAKESLDRASEKLLHLRNEKEQLLAQYQEIETQLSPNSSKPPSDAGDGVPVDAEADSVPMDDEPPPPVTGQPVDTRASWPVAPELDVFVENSDSTKRARVTLPSGSLLVEAVESGQFGEEEAKRMMAALCKMGVVASPDAVPLRPEFPEDWESEPNL